MKNEELIASLREQLKVLKSQHSRWIPTRCETILNYQSGGPDYYLITLERQGENPIYRVSSEPIPIKGNGYEECMKQVYQKERDILAKLKELGYKPSIFEMLNPY